MPKTDLAPEGAIWICECCGRKNKDRYGFDDPACFINSVLVYDEISIIGPSGEQRYRMFPVVPGAANE